MRVSVVGFTSFNFLSNDCKYLSVVAYTMNDSPSVNTGGAFGYSQSRLTYMARKLSFTLSLS